MPDEFTLDQLEEKDYSHNPREQKRYIGQNVSIRYLDPQDKIDALRLKTTIESQAVQKWMEDLKMSDSDYKEWMKEQGPAKNRRHHLFAVTESQGSNINEIGELQGFVYFYSGKDEREQAGRLVKEGLIRENDVRGKRLLEISYAKKPDSPPRRMTGGIMQACIVLSNVMQRKSDQDPKNILVVAYTDPENSSSIKAAEESGFTYVGTVSGYGEDQKPNGVYILDWDILNKKLQTLALNDIKFN